MNRLFVWAVILVVGTGWAMADDATPVRAEDKKAATEFLGKNVRIEFKRMPRDENDQGVFIITASPAFATVTSMNGANGDVEFQVSGRVELRDGGGILVTYEASMAFNGNGQGAKFRAASSVLLQPGQELGVSRMGDKTLVIRASYVDSAATAE